MSTKALATKATEARILSPIAAKALRLAYAATVVLTPTNGWAKGPIVEAAHLPLFAVLSQRIKALAFYTGAMKEEVATASSQQVSASSVRLVEWLSPMDARRWPLLEASRLAF